MTRVAPHSREKELIFCHDNNIQTLTDIIKSGNIPHAFLFSGQKGIGKSTAAYHFAKMLLSIDSGPQEQEAPGDLGEVDLFGSPQVTPPKAKDVEIINNNVAQKVSNRSHMDLFILENNKEDSKNISVDEIRDISRFLSLTPAESKYRVAVIDAIDDFSINASNAILKILEEPTKNTVLIIICHSKINLLPTIKSRCLELKFNTLKKKDFLIVLSDLGYSEKKLEDVYELSYGSPGLAFEILEKNVNELLDKYKKIIANKTVKISDVIALAKEIKDKDAWKIFGDLFLNYYSKVIRSEEITKKSLDKFNEISEIIYFSEVRNMDIQDSLKYITNHINNI